MLFYLVFLSSVLITSAAPARHLDSDQLSTTTTSTTRQQRFPPSLCTGVNSDGHPLQEDTCGVCGGNGSTCRKHTYTMEPSTAMPGQAEYKPISIPKGVRRLSILKETSTIANIALQTKAGKVFLHAPDRDTDIDFRGTILHYSRTSTGSELVNSQGKVKALFLVTVKLTGPVSDTSTLPWVTVTYVRDVREPSDNSYSWSVGDWSVCTRTCGGGVRTRRVVCHRHRRRGQPIVSRDSFCEEAEGQKPHDMNLCSPFRCPTADEPVYIWRASSWSQCSEQCGYQTRQVACYKMIPGSVTVVHDSQCNFIDKPPDTNDCNGPQCPVVGCKDGKLPCSFLLKISLLNCSNAKHRSLCCASCQISTSSTQTPNRRGSS